MNMTITSSAFTHNGSIQKQYTCEGTDISQNSPGAIFQQAPRVWF